MLDQMKAKVRAAADQYAANCMRAECWDNVPQAAQDAYALNIKAAFLSGFTISTSALIRADGSELTPHLLWKAATEVGRELGLTDERLNDSRNNESGKAPTDTGSSS